MGGHIFKRCHIARCGAQKIVENPVFLLEQKIYEEAGKLPLKGHRPSLGSTHWSCIPLKSILCFRRACAKANPPSPAPIISTRGCDACIMLIQLGKFGIEIWLKMVEGYLEMSLLSKRSHCLQVLPLIPRTYTGSKSDTTSSRTLRSCYHVFDLKPKSERPTPGGLLTIVRIHFYALYAFFEPHRRSRRRCLTN
jgi:hypothetical protein